MPSDNEQVRRSKLSENNFSRGRRLLKSILFYIDG